MRKNKDIDNLIIVFGQHTLNTLGQIRSFGEAGLEVIVVWLDRGFHSPKGSKYIRDFNSVNSIEEGLNVIINKYKSDDKNKKNIISTDSDAVVSLLDKHYDELKDYFLFFHAGKQGRLTSYMPKEKQCRLVEKYGIKIPKTELVRWGDMPQELIFPIFTKAVDSFGASWKDDAQICYTEKELVSFYSKKNKKGNILLQEYIDRENEVALEGISFNGGDYLFLPIQGEYLRLPEGVYGTVKRNSPYQLGEELKKSIQLVMKEIGYTGVFEIEFIRSKKNELFFLEINFRHTQYNHALTDMGVNIAELWMKNVVGIKCEMANMEIKESSVVINESRDYRYFVKTGKITVLKWISDLFHADSYYLLDKRDWLFCLRYFFKSLWMKTPAGKLHIK